MTNRMGGIIAALTALLSTSACWFSPGNDDEVIVGGVWMCNGKSTPNWNSMWPELSWEFDYSRGCPYVVDSAQSVMPFEMEFWVQPRTNPQQWRHVSWSVWNNTGSRIAYGNYHYFYLWNPNGTLRAVINSQYPGGTGSSPSFSDSTYFLVDGGSYSPVFPWVKHKIDGTIRTVTPAISGQTYVVSGYPQGWEADVSGSGLSYRYQWAVDGYSVPGATNQSFIHTLDPGEYTISVEIRLSDETVYNRQLLVTAVDCGGPNIC